MKKILITGANSYIGTSFERYIKQFDSYMVDTIDMIDGSWREKSFVDYDAVFHVAGIAHSDFGKIGEDRKQLYYSVNTELAIETAKKAKVEGVKQFVFMSSASVYGESAPIGKSKVITIDTPMTPSNYYGDSKFKAEKGLELLRDDKFRIAIIRPPMIYGEGCKGNYPTLSKFAKKFPVFPCVKNERSMLYVGNLTGFIKLMIDNCEDGVFFPQNSEYSNTSDVVKMISQVHNKQLLLIKGFSWALKIMSKFTGMVNKAFGNLTYDMNLSEYKCDYRKFSLEKSIRITEGIDQRNKPRAMMLASVASMIDQFNMNNIQLLLDNGYDVDVVCSFGAGNNISQERGKQVINTLTQMGVTVYDVPIPRKLSDIKGIFCSLKQVKSLSQKYDYQLIHCHSPIGSVIGRLAFKGKRKNGVRVIYTAHGFHFYKGAPLINWLLFYPVEKYLSRYTDVLITINQEDYEFAQCKLKAKKIVYVPGIGVDTEFFGRDTDVSAIKSELGLGNLDKIVLSVGELNCNKNHQAVIKAISKLNDTDIQYLIVGIGDNGEELKRLAASLGVNLRLLGYRTDMDVLYKIADVYAFPSYREGLSVSLMEAMASGLPCIVSNIRGNVDLIDEGQGGYTCKSDDFDSFAQKINELLDDEKKRQKYGEYNKNKIKNFDKNNVLKMIAKIYFN